ncbi:RHS repeat-associated core domain-containing protein, partial [candidate division WOR-3 bacterium]|nr:RHS repeat-associated core domain-containing protein [candidate division WOR-3 bacterium]
GTYYDNHKFTGKEEDGSGLYYFGARYYDKSIGRWISPDPASYPSDLRLNQPQSLNPYVYCWNNPLRRIDKDGKEPFTLSIATCMAIGTGTAVGTDFIVSAALAGKSPVAYWKSGQYSMKRMAVVGGVGAVSGAAFGVVSGLSISVAAKVLLGAGINIFGKQVTKETLEGKSITLEEGLIAGATGGLSMGLGLGLGKLVGLSPQNIQPALGGAATGLTSADVIETIIKRSIDEEQESTPPAQTLQYQYEHAPADPDVLLNREGNEP